jgi:hypothetical protein
VLPPPAQSKANWPAQTETPRLRDHGEFAKTQVSTALKMLLDARIANLNVRTVSGSDRVNLGKTATSGWTLTQSLPLPVL